MKANPPMVRTAEEDLPSLARKVNEAHAEAESTGRASLDRARLAGEALLRARGRVAPGRWLAWLNANVACDQRTAQRYMRVAEQWDRCQAAASLTAALDLLAPVREEGPDLFGAGIDLDAAAAAALAALPAEQQLAVLRGNEERVARLASAQRERDQADARAQRLRAIRRHLDTARRLAEALGVVDLVAQLERAGLLVGEA